MNHWEQYWNTWVNTTLQSVWLKQVYMSSFQTIFWKLYVFSQHSQWENSRWHLLKISTGLERYFPGIDWQFVNYLLDSTSQQISTGITFVIFMLIPVGAFWNQFTLCWNLFSVTICTCSYLFKPVQKVSAGLFPSAGVKVLLYEMNLIWFISTCVYNCKHF